MTDAVDELERDAEVDLDAEEREQIEEFVERMSELFDRAGDR